MSQIEALSLTNSCNRYRYSVFQKCYQVGGYKLGLSRRCGSCMVLVKDNIEKIYRVTL